MSDQNVNPYLSGADAASQQSPYMAAPVGADNGASRFSSAPADADFLRTQPVNGNDGGQWNNGNIANQQDQNADSAGAQVGDTLQLQDGTTVELTPELHGLMGQFHQSVESQLGQGTVDAMLQYAGTLDAGTQSTLNGWSCLAIRADVACGSVSARAYGWRFHYRLRPERPDCRATCRNVTC